MKAKVTSLLLNAGVLGLHMFSALNAGFSTCHTQGTAFTYQGRLSDDSGIATGPNDFEIRLSSAAMGGSQVGPTLPAAPSPAANSLQALRPRI